MCCSSEMPLLERAAGCRSHGRGGISLARGEAHQSIRALAWSVAAAQERGVGGGVTKGPRPGQSTGPGSCCSPGGDTTAADQQPGAQREPPVSREHMHVSGTHKTGLDKPPRFFPNRFEREFLRSRFCIRASPEAAVPFLPPEPALPPLCPPAEPTATSFSQWILRSAEDVKHGALVLPVQYSALLVFHLTVVCGFFFFFGWVLFCYNTEEIHVCLCFLYTEHR